MMEINLRLYLTTFPCNSIEVLVTIKIFMQTTVPIRKKYILLSYIPFRFDFSITWLIFLL
uniref:Uncharacterized protein n=1 Tax=Panthera tigris altaica TaxID=74533 RepID=A0A8C9KAK5_PANTA